MKKESPFRGIVWSPETQERLRAQMNNFAMKDFSDAIEILLRSDDLRSVTVFCSPLKDVRQIVRATRQRKYDARDRSHQIVVSYGKPNYMERKLIEAYKIAKTPQPRTWQHRYLEKRGV